MRSTLLTILLSSVLLASQQLRASGSTADYQPFDKAAPTVKEALNTTLQGVEDRSPHKLADWGGKVLLVNYWATWCPPCVRETPLLIDLQEELGGQGLQIVGIATQQIDEQTGKVSPMTDADTATVKQFIENTPFLKKRPVNYPMLMANQQIGKMVAGFGGHLVALPVTILLDRHGKVLMIHAGELRKAEVEKIIRSALQSSTGTAHALTDRPGAAC